jgi:hypothetical protein
LNKGKFIPVQLYFDVMSMVKNVYFCIGKTQIDNPKGRFWIILLGTDVLEKVFGQVRTMVGTDTNYDQLQLTSRIDGAVQCINILEDHPEWGGGSRRLTLKPLSKDPDSVSSKHDHINPKSWKGDVEVSKVVLSGCWREGRRTGEEELQKAGILVRFGWMEGEGGFDILCPFRHAKMVLVDGKVHEEEQEETEEEADHPITADAPPATDSTPVDQLDIEPDVEDFAGVEELEQAPVEE